MLKKLLSCLLIMAMVWAMLPVNAVQPQADTVRKQAIIPEETATMINPLYADELTEEDCLHSLEAPILGAAAGSEEEYVYTYEEAAKQLREGMKQRKGIVQIYFCTENYNFSTDAPAIWEESLTHTGVPTEGDYLKWVWASCNCGGGGYIINNVYYVTFTFTLSYYTTAEQEAELDEAVEDLLSELNPTGTDYQKLKTVYDYICANITYDNDSEGKLKHTAYAALINKTAVCQGYATLLYRLALEMGIDIRLISGIGNGGAHGWNIVELNDVYYNVDSTWDATWMQHLGYYDFFLQCEDSFTEGGTDHIRDEEYDTAQFHADYPMSQTDFNPETDDVPDNIVASGTCGENLSWALDENGTLTISGTGAMDNYDTSNDAPWDSYRESITDVVIGGDVTTIGNYAFFWCNNLTGVTIPESVTSIGRSTFAECSGLSKITFLGDAPTFDGDVFSGVTAIAYYPADNDTWTDEVMQNYGGTITWVAYTNCDHTSTSVINAKAATCTEAGYTGDTYCNDCKVTIAYGTEIEMKDHTPVTDAAVAATCTTAGKTEGSHCADCNTVIVVQTVIPAKGHTGGSVCTECGEVKYIAGDMDRDGVLTVADILSLKNLILAGALSDEELGLADLNNDGKLNVVDIILAKNLILSQ